MYSHPQGCFSAPVNFPILRHPNWVSYNSITRTSPRPPSLRALSQEKCPLQAPLTRPRGCCASDPQAVGWAFSRPLWNPLRFHNLLEWLTEPRKAVYLRSLVYCKGYSSGRGEGKTCRGQGVIGGWGPSSLGPSRHGPPPAPPHLHHRGALRTVVQEFFQSSVCSPIPSPDVRGGGGGAESPTVTTRCFQ